MVPYTKYAAGRAIVEYRFQKAIDENRFIYQTRRSGEGMYYFELYIYDIRDASSTKLGSNYWGYFIISNDSDEYVTSAAVYGGGEANQRCIFMIMKAEKLRI